MAENPLDARQYSALVSTVLFETIVAREIQYDLFMLVIRLFGFPLAAAEYDCRMAVAA
jgi:hypothetical protein